MATYKSYVLMKMKNPKYYSLVNSEDIDKVPLTPITIVPEAKFKILNFASIHESKIIVPYTNAIVVTDGVNLRVTKFGIDKFYEIVDIGDGFFNLVCRKSKNHFYTHARTYEKTSACFIL